MTQNTDGIHTKHNFEVNNLLVSGFQSKDGTTGVKKSPLALQNDKKL